MTAAEAGAVAVRVGMIAESATVEALKSQSASHAQVAIVVRQAVEAAIRENLTSQGRLM
jgi:hypothetical protein